MYIHSLAELPNADFCGAFGIAPSLKNQIHIGNCFIYVKMPPQ